MKKVGTVLRLIGGAPTENELNEVVSTFGEEGTLSFTEFLGIVEKHRSNHGFMGDELRFLLFYFQVEASESLIYFNTSTKI